MQCKNSINKQKPRALGACGFLIVGTAGLNQTEPLHGFCAGFSLAEGLVIVTSRRQLVQAIGAAPLNDTGVDINAAVRFECRHGRMSLRKLR